MDFDFYVQFVCSFRVKTKSVLFEILFLKEEENPRKITIFHQAVKTQTKVDFETKK